MFPLQKKENKGLLGMTTLTKTSSFRDIFPYICIYKTLQEQDDANQSE